MSATPISYSVEHRVHPRDALELHELIDRSTDVTDAYASRLGWLEALAAWVHGDGGLISRSTDEDRTQRLRTLVHALASLSGFRDRFAAALTGVVRELHGTKLFADVGLPVEPGFWREALHRVVRRVLPKPPAPKSFADFMRRLFPTPAAAAWLERSPAAPWERLWALVESTATPLSSAWSTLAQSMREAIRILAARIAGLDGGQRTPSAPFRPRVGVVYRIELRRVLCARLEELERLVHPADADALPANLGRFAMRRAVAQFRGRTVLDHPALFGVAFAVAFVFALRAPNIRLGHAFVKALVRCIFGSPLERLLPAVTRPRRSFASIPSIG